MYRVVAAMALLAGCTAKNPFAIEPDLSMAIEDLAMMTVLPDLASDTPFVDLLGVDLTKSPADMAVLESDLANADLRQPDLKPVVATANAIDTNQFADGARVNVEGLVVIGVTRLEDVTNQQRCVYGAYAQDPIGAAPAGLHLSVIGDMCTPGDMGSCRCKQPPATNTLLDTITALGDLIDVQGEVDIFQPLNSPVQHSLRLVAITKTGSGGNITPTVFTDGTSFADDGLGYTSHESMLVKIQPASAFTISTVDNFGNFSGSGAEFAGLYRFFYPGTPPDSSTWSSITGVAQPAFGGGIAPRIPGDFVP
jgi:hypothetical protein